MHCRGNGLRALSLYKNILYLVSGVIVFGLSEVRAQVENYNDWTGHLQITINTTTLGLSGSCIGFPLLIRLNSSNFPYFGQTLAGGADIRFSKANYASHLSYEIERWDAANGNAEIWVKVDTVLPNSATQSIMMHWGKSGETGESNPAGVFVPGNGFLGTYHLGGNLNDATGNGNNGSDNNTVDTSTGIIGRARAFNGSSQYFTAGDLADRPSGAISFWFRPKEIFNSASTTQGIYGKKADNSNNVTLSLCGDDFLNGPDGVKGCIVTKNEQSDVGLYNRTTSVTWAAGAWYHIVWSWNGSTDSLYVNGALQRTTSSSVAVAGAALDEIGRSNYDTDANVTDGQPKYFNGTLDEFRIDHFSRSAKWNKLGYETQRPDQSVVTFSFVDNENYTTSWPFHTDIVINTTNSGGGANTTERVYSFPLSIRLNPANFATFGQTLPGGADIRFAKSDGTHLSYEIERWVDGASNSDTAEIWVRIDTVLDQNSTQLVRMYWGNPAAASRSNPSAVFSTAYGYAGAWHMNEAPGEAGSIKDRTANAYNGTPAGGMSASASVNGVIGKALEFDGTDDHIALPSIPTDFTGGLTISGWMQFHTFRSFSRLIDFSENGQANDNIFVVNVGTSPGLRFGLLTGSTQYLVDTSGFFTANSWDYVTCVYTGAQQAVYRNGILIKSVARTNALANVTRTTNYIARSNWPTDSGYDGLIDELQLSRLARSASSIKLSYETQKPGGTAVVVCFPATIIQDPVNATVNVGDSATFSVIATGAKTRQWQRSTGGGAWSNVTAGVGGTTATYKFRTDSSDTNRRFRCMLTGNCGARDSTNAATLTLCFLISITGHPADAINVAPGREVTFSVQATGTGVSYQWEKSADGGTVWTAISGATGNQYTLTVAAGDDGSKYRCRAFNTCNSANSNAASLTVCAPPSIVLQPVNRSVIEGQTASFSISATGTPPRSYQWIRKVGGGIAWDTVSGAIDTFCTMVTKASDHASDFRCIVRGACGACTSSVATLIVYQKVKAYFTVSDSLGEVPLDVRFTDSSSGAISKWKWSFGDGEADSTDSAGTVTHTYDSAKVYTVTLTVSGPGGIDSTKRTITVYPIEGNPVVITGRYISATSVELLLKNYAALRSEFPPPFVTDIRLWNRINALPADTATARTLATYTIAALKARGVEYRDTVAVDALAPPDSAYGFMTEIVWNDGQTSPFAAINGCLVLMRDTVKPANPVVLSGRYAPWDTVFFRFDSASKIDTAKADSVALWFGTGTDTVPDFSTQTNIRWWSARDVVKGVSGSAFSYIVKSDQFNSERKLLNCAIMVLGKNKLRSPVKSVSFTIGRVRPSNPIVLKALALNANSIRLGWNKLDPDSVEKVRIYYRTGGEFGDEYDFSNVTPRDSVVPSRPG
jgi:PKD repeat protein